MLLKIILGLQTHLCSPPLVWIIRNHIAKSSIPILLANILATYKSMVSTLKAYSVCAKSQLTESDPIHYVTNLLLSCNFSLLPSIQQHYHLYIVNAPLYGNKEEWQCLYTFYLEHVFKFFISEFNILLWSNFRPDKNYKNHTKGFHISFTQFPHVLTSERTTVQWSKPKT